MKRKIIIKSEDFNREISSFLKEVGADMPIDWNNEALDRIKDAVIQAYEKMGVTLEIDDRLQSIPSSNLSKAVRIIFLDKLNKLFPDLTTQIPCV
jgi:hypothetical protein